MQALPRYAELQCLTNFSFLKGASHPEELVVRAAELGYAALAITDECSLAGVVRAHAEAKDSGLKLIIGSSFVLEDGLQLVVLATNLNGYGNLSETITLARMRCAKGEYRLTRADLDGSPQPAGAIPEAAGAIDHLAGLPDCLVLWVPGRDASPAQLEADARWVATTFARPGAPTRPRAWIAIQRTHRMDDEPVLRRLLKLGIHAGLRCVATGDVHMHVRSRKPLHDTLTAVRLNRAVADCGDALAPNAERHLRSRLRLPNLFPEALLEETVTVADECSFSLKELGYRYPKEIVPEGQTQTGYLRQLTEEGLVTRYPEGVLPEVRKQVDHELALIAELKYEAFFLTVHDIVRYARSVGILCQGRGSAANSAVCFCLGITEVNPALQKMLFERFLTKERNEPPDIDVDFEHQRREEVIQYIYDKYGRHRTALAATVIAYRTRSAIRDVGKALGLDGERVNRLSSSHAWWEGGEGHRARLEENGFDPDSPVVRKLVELTSTLRSFPRHLSQHVGGFVISDGKLSRMVPIENAAMLRPSDWDDDAGRRTAYATAAQDGERQANRWATSERFGGSAPENAGDASDVHRSYREPARTQRRHSADGRSTPTGDAASDEDDERGRELGDGAERPDGDRRREDEAGGLDRGDEDGEEGRDRGDEDGEGGRDHGDADGERSGERGDADGQRSGDRGFANGQGGRGNWPDEHPGVGKTAEDPASGVRSGHGAFEPQHSGPLRADLRESTDRPNRSVRASRRATGDEPALFPTFRSVIQWDKDDLEELGLLKVDVLALGMLSAVRRALDLVGQRRGQRFRMSDIPPEDGKTYDMICKADTVGVFQIESRAQMSMLPRMLPRTFYDLVVEVAIVRPGPIQGGMVHPYLKAREDIRNGKEITYPAPAVKEALERTLGVPIFQEQVMQLMMLAADFSAGEADKLRRAMAAWKRKGGLGPFHDRIVNGMIENGYEREYAERIFKQVEGFGEYGFPESHAASFAFLVYISCWIKCHEPAAFLAAMLNSQPLGFYSSSQLIQDARRHDVEVRPIDVTISGWDAVLEEREASSVEEEQAGDRARRPGQATASESGNGASRGGVAIDPGHGGPVDALDRTTHRRLREDTSDASDGAFVHRDAAHLQVFGKPLINEAGVARTGNASAAPLDCTDRDETPTVIGEVAFHSYARNRQGKTHANLRCRSVADTDGDGVAGAVCDFVASTDGLAAAGANSGRISASDGVGSTDCRDIADASCDRLTGFGSDRAAGLDCSDVSGLASHNIADHECQGDSRMGGDGGADADSDEVAGIGHANVPAIGQRGVAGRDRGDVRMGCDGAIGIEQSGAGGNGSSNAGVARHGVAGHHCGDDDPMDGKNGGVAGLRRNDVSTIARKNVAGQGRTEFRAKNLDRIDDAVSEAADWVNASGLCPADCGFEAHKGHSSSGNIAGIDIDNADTRDVAPQDAQSTASADAARPDQPGATKIAATQPSEANVERSITRAPQPAVRLGLNSIRSFSLKAAERVLAARSERPFTSVEDLGRRAALSTMELDALAAADALTKLVGHRRQARWEAASHRLEKDLMRATKTEEPTPTLPLATEGSEIADDYASTGFTLRRHPLALLRPRLRRMGLLSAAELHDLSNGRLVKTTGIVTVRQRPGTAKGTIFLSLEDETGVINVIVWNHVIEKQRRPLLTARLLTVYGIWQRQGEVRNVVAHQLIDHSRLTGHLNISSRDFH